MRKPRHQALPVKLTVETVCFQFLKDLKDEKFLMYFPHQEDITMDSEYCMVHCGKCPKLWACFEVFGHSKAAVYNVDWGYVAGVFLCSACCHYQLHCSFKGYKDSCTEDFAFLFAGIVQWCDADICRGTQS